MSVTNKVTTELLKSIVDTAEENHDGETANYIPELANVDNTMTGIGVWPLNGEAIYCSNLECAPVTLQSTSKLIPLIGLLEEYGEEELFKWVLLEPSGDDFASITRLEQFGPKPSNPMLNAGAITLCSHIPGTGEHQFAWLENWTHRLFNRHLRINPLVFSSEKRTGDKNRALAYLLNSRHNLKTNVTETLDLYFTLCSYEATLEQMLYLPTLLANSGICPLTSKRVISAETAKITQAIMATCGLYDETGTYMVRCGIPAKSGVSGYIIASAPKRGGVVVLSPKVNAKGNSIRGTIMLEALSKALNWHFAV